MDDFLRILLPDVSVMGDLEECTAFCTPIADVDGEDVCVYCFISSWREFYKLYYHLAHKMYDAFLMFSDHTL